MNRSVYLVRAFLTVEAFHDGRADHERYFVTEPGESFEVSVRAESYRRKLAREALRPGHPSYKHLTCRYVPANQVPATAHPGAIEAGERDDD